MIVQSEGNSVVIVDDDRTFRFVAEKMLKREGCINVNIEKYEDGKEFMDAVEETLLSSQLISDGVVVLLDLFMPNMDGWKVLQSLQSKHDSGVRLPKLFVVSSSVDVRDVKKARSYDFVFDYFPKPLTSENCKLVCNMVSN